MNTRILGLAALLAFSAGSGAMAQAAADPAATQAAVLPVAAGAVGHWLRDPQGHGVLAGAVRDIERHPLAEPSHDHAGMKM